ncbi:MAG: endonuclease III, partial [Myxococcota bacterium]
KKTSVKKTSVKKTAVKKTAAKKTAAKKTVGGLAAVPQLDAPPPAELVTRTKEIHRRLARAQPDPQVELDHQDAWQLLIATILAARSNDRIINAITPALFARWPTPQALASAAPADVEQVVKRSGFFRQKARAIQSTATAVVEQFGGEVPRTMEQLVTLPGVARKTANVVLSSVFGVGSGIIVDLHVTRLVERLGLTADKDARRIEALLCALFPRRAWAAVGHRLVLHGRHVCTARKPRCARCPLHEVCPSAAESPAGRWTERARWEQRLTEARGRLDPAET